MKTCDQKIVSSTSVRSLWSGYYLDGWLSANTNR